MLGTGAGIVRTILHQIMKRNKESSGRQLLGCVISILPRRKEKKMNKCESKYNGNNVGLGNIIKSFERYEIGDPLTPFLKATESFMLCEALHKKAERAEKLKLPKAEYYENTSLLHNRQGLNRLAKAKELMKKAVEKFPELEKECGVISKQDIEKILGDCDIMIKNEIFETELSPEIAEEFWEIYQEVRNSANQKGLRGILHFCDAKIGALEDVRKDPMKGRQPASPIAFFIALIIGIIIGASVYAVIECYNKHGCQWVEDALRLVGCMIIMGDINTFNPALLPEHCKRLLGWI